MKSITKIQLASDLHLNQLMRTHPKERLVRQDVDADVLVLAGDIHGGAMAVDAFSNWNKPIVMIAGNHEGYGLDWDDTRKSLAMRCKDSNIHFLDNSSVVIGGVRFLGTTLWSDFMVDGFTQEQGMKRLEHGIMDYTLIRLKRNLFTTKVALQEHLECRNWLEKALDEKFDGPTVVVTHHGPHPKSIHPRWKPSGINGGFVSDLTPLLKKAKLWLHGHVHDSFDYTVEGCRVVTNPHGYIRNHQKVSTAAEFEVENKHFNSGLVLKI